MAEESFFSRVKKRICTTYEGDEVPKSTRWIYPISGLGRDATYAIVATFLLIFVQEAGYLDVKGADYASQFLVITGLIIGYRIFDAINDPFMGVIIEKVHLKTGKFKPWIVLGAWLNSITVLALFGGPSLFTWCRGWGFVAWFGVFYLLWGMTFTINDISFYSMLPSLSQSEQQRAKLCSTLSIFENLGAFTVALFIPMFSLPERLGNKAYWIAAIIVCALFVIGQTLIFFFCPEKKRNLEAEAKAEKPKFSDMFKIVKQNKLVRLMVIVVFLWFVSTGVFAGLMQNVFYLQAGYEAGKNLMSAFAFVQVAAVILPNLFMPKILKKYPKMSVLKFFLVVIIAGYLIYFFYGSPFGSFVFAPSNFIAYSVLLFIILTFIYVSNGAIYTLILLLMSNTIEYNEWKFYARKESVIFSLRPFSTKFASSVQQGVTTLAQMASGAIAVSNIINEYANKPGASSEEIQREIDKVVTSGMIWNLKCWAVILPIVILIVTLIITVKFYDLDEKKYQEICDEIKKRNEANA